MNTSAGVQEAKKAKQLERLEAKKSAGEDPEGYAKYYASQPLQIERAKKHEAHQEALQSLRNANEALAIAEITGENLETARQEQAIATLVAERAQPPERGAGNAASLSGA